MRTAAALREARTTLAKAGIGGAALEAEVLVMHAAGHTREAMYASLTEPVAAPAQERLNRFIERRLQREPLAYITGHREFFGLDFSIDRRVLVPRQETETLVELTLDIAKSACREGCAIADVGTGSGAIAISLATQLPKATVYATDISSEALDVAQANSERHGVAGRVRLLQGDLLTPLSSPVDIVVANLPYIAHSDAERLQPEIRLYEPPLALYAQDDGLSLVVRLLEQVEALAQRPTWALLELGEGQARKATDAARRILPGATVASYRDLGGMERGLIIGLTT